MIGRFRTIGSAVTLSTTSSQVQRKRKPSSSVCALSEGSYGILIQYAHTENNLGHKYRKHLPNNNNRYLVENYYLCNAVYSHVTSRGIRGLRSQSAAFIR